MTDKKPSSKKTAQSEKQPALVQMIDAIGRIADVHPSMVDEYRKGGYQVAK